MGACQETRVDKWGQAARPPSENCWPRGLARQAGAKPPGPPAHPAAGRTAVAAERDSGRSDAPQGTQAEWGRVGVGGLPAASSSGPPGEKKEQVICSDSTGGREDRRAPTPACITHARTRAHTRKAWRWAACPGGTGEGRGRAGGGHGEGRGSPGRTGPWSRCRSGSRWAGSPRRTGRGLGPAAGTETSGAEAAEREGAGGAV